MNEYPFIVEGGAEYAKQHASSRSIEVIGDVSSPSPLRGEGAFAPNETTHTTPLDGEHPMNKEPQ